ncbi:hypothetical protein C9374_004546 [Naegleria lovaniensis]|uniref:CHCH domain-containing protein n=1 Tax=Naegleria lovaniensis TaxID=51637 RepID=A0AA88KIU1_NAELO|nr:uncharacterized protein C9374_004546 [Naegleria lovaniensis]KAG2383209.1 hypothetical protein C9374_004546 [Naegleria lovaniensis]
MNKTKDEDNQFTPEQDSSEQLSPLEQYQNNVIMQQIYFNTPPIVVSNREYIPEKPCQDLLQLFTKCENEYKNNRSDIMCAEFKESYLECRRKFNSLKKEIEAENLVRSKVFYFTGENVNVASVSKPNSVIKGKVIEQ